MPKRWKVVQSNSFTWQFVERERGGPLRVLAQSNESWETRDEVRAEIDRMKQIDEFDEDDE
jgi:hypothetical protein